MREIRPSGSEGGGTEFNRSSLPLSTGRTTGVVARLSESRNERHSTATAKSGVSVTIPEGDPSNSPGLLKRSESYPGLSGHQCPLP